MGIAMDVTQPRKLVVFDRIELLFEGLGIGMLPRRVLSVPFDQAQFQTNRAVPAACLKYRIIRRRIDPDLVG